MSYHFYVESKKMIQMNLFTKQKQTHRHRKQTYGYQRVKWGGEKTNLWFIKGESGVGRDKLGVWD